MKLFNLESPLMRALAQCGDLIILNFVWIICCIPIVTIGAATTAMYSCYLNRSTESSTLRRFFHSFKINFTQSTILFGMELIGLLLVYANIRFYLSYSSNVSIVLQIAFMIPSVLILSVMGYIYPLQAHFDNTVKQTLKNAVLMCVANFPISILVLGINLMPLIIILIDVEFFLKISIIFILMGSTSIAFVNSFLLLKVFRRYLPSDEKNEQEGANLDE